MSARRLVPEIILNQQAAGRMRGHFRAAALFVDISGFTALTETLMQHAKDGAEVLTDVLNDIFGPVVAEVYRRGALSLRLRVTPSRRCSRSGGAMPVTMPCRRRSS